VTIHDFSVRCVAVRPILPRRQLNDPAISGPTPIPIAMASPSFGRRLGLDPKTSDASGLPVAGIVNGSLTLTYTRIKSATEHQLHT